MRRLLAVLLFSGAITAQEVITEAKVKAIVSYLASDELAGRDSPSPGLEAAAKYIADHFAAAGLQQVANDSWFHGYQLPGLRLDSTTIVLKVRREQGEKGEKTEQKEAKDLQADTEVRLYRAGDSIGEDDQVATVASAGDARTDRLLMNPGSRRPMLLEIDTADPRWASSQGVHSLLGKGRQGGRPVFLVKKGALPPGDPNAEDAHYVVNYKITAPQPADVELKNVVGLLRGSSKPEEYVLVSAHYDHIGIGMPIDGDAINNGADDDASGTTAVVLLAEALAKQPRPARSVLFVCFSAEEKGLRGSRAFAERPPVPLEQVVANVNIEMIGRPDADKHQQAWITGPDYSDFAAIAGPALHRAGIELVGFDMAKALFAASDNYSLAQKGVVAHSISAGSLHADYHRPSDEVAKLQLPHMTAVIKGLREVVREFAEREQRPAYNDAGRKVLERAGRR